MQLQAQVWCPVVCPSLAPASASSNYHISGKDPFYALSLLFTSPPLYFPHPASLWRLSSNSSGPHKGSLEYGDFVGLGFLFCCFSRFLLP